MAKLSEVRIIHGNKLNTYPENTSLLQR